MSVGTGTWRTFVRLAIGAALDVFLLLLMGRQGIPSVTAEVAERGWLSRSPPGSEVAACRFVGS
jgi:hypothetical protein